MQQIDINFYSLCRSGHHAIIFWFLKNIGKYETNDPEKIYTIVDKNLYYFNNTTTFQYQYPKDYDWLIKNSEDVFYFYGPKNFVIVRDFLNLIASRYKMWGDSIGYSSNNYITDINLLISVWKQHVSRAKRHPNNIIFYNKWILNKEYRDAVSDFIGYPNINDDTTYVPMMGNGSSFIGINKEENPNNYNQRFKQILLPENLILAILTDYELVEMNKFYFDIDLNIELFPEENQH